MTEYLHRTEIQAMRTLLRTLIPALFITCGPIAIAQISFGGQAFGFIEHGPALPEPELVVMPEVDSEALMAEDEARYATDVKGPYRFGFNHATDLSLENSGTWMERPNGDRLWRLSIECPGAYSINFEFHDYVIPYGGLVFVTNEMGQQLGAFTAASNPGRTTLGVTQMAGDRITVEYYEPAEVRGEGRLRIGQVTHGYRDIFKMAKGLGDSGSCNINVICPEGDDWQPQISATAIITTGGNGFCTGTMLNNCEEDGTPYFLTANHCLSPDVENWVFRWNWESPTCDPTENGPTDQTVSGCQLLVNSAATDVALLLLNTPPPPDYEVYYSGWDKTDIPADTVICVHHPAGDIKKISHAYAPVIEGVMSGADCWQVQEWSVGTTEPGSSGSGLWNQDGLLVGQLFGGQASCSFNFNDFYGRFDLSYPLLANYLGDCGDQLPGLGDEIVVPTTADVAVTSINSIPEILCGTDIITPMVTLKNNGTGVVTSMTITYGVAGEPPAINGWTGSLQPLQTVNYNLPAISVPAGEHILTAATSMPNGNVDQEPDNDAWEYAFTVNNPGSSVTLHLNTDNYGSDVSWVLTSELGTELYEGGPYQNVNGGEEMDIPMCLTNGCYTFTITDLFGDGICCENGEGGYAIIDENWVIHVESNGQYGTGEEWVFCLSEVGISEHGQSGELSIHPNPSTGLVRMGLTGVRGASVLRLTDGMGRRVMEQNIPALTQFLQLDLSDLSNGIYMVALEHAQGRITERLLIQR